MRALLTQPLESIMITRVIDAKEERDVITGMCIDMGLRFSVNFGHEKFLPGKFPVICWYWYWDVHVARR